jgi:hypothetical protein
LEASRRQSRSRVPFGSETPLWTSKVTDFKLSRCG